MRGVKKRASGSGRLVALDLNEQPARCAVNSHEQIAPTSLVGHLGQVFDIDVEEHRIIAFKGFVWQSGFFGREGVEVANAVAVTPIEARACGIGAKKVEGDGQQVVPEQKQRISQFDHDFFLCRSKRDLKSVRGVRGLMKSVTALPFVAIALTHDVAERQYCRSLRAGRHPLLDGGLITCVFYARQSSSQDSRLDYGGDAKFF